MSDIAFKYDEKKNPAGTWIDGVPLRDLTADEFKAMPKHLQAAVKREPYYVAAGAVDAGQSLTAVSGIGPKTAEKLAAISIFTPADLVEHLDDIHVERIAESAGVTPQQVVEWQARAMAIIDGYDTEGEEE